MDDRTHTYYATRASDVVARYEVVVSPVEQYFHQAFTPGGRVLDIGAGSGRDLAALKRMGFAVEGFEPVAELRSEAVCRHPELAGLILDGSLPGIDPPQGRKYDGILCSAVLMHLPEGELFDAAFALRRCLKQHGRLLISVSANRGDVGGDGRDADGRLLKCYPPDYLQLLFERLGFLQIGRWSNDDVFGRSGISWITLLFELRAGDTITPVDQIEGILNRDKKDATYKLALFRALAEIAMKESNSVRWMRSGHVAVPLRSVAKKWLFYYWPLFAADGFVPQKRGEAPACRKPVKFRGRHQALIRRFGPAQGGLTGFALDFASGITDPDLRREVESVLKNIEATIVTGPVEYAGNSLATGRVFEFDRTSRSIVMQSDLWRELSLLGHWIGDAVVLRWAELTQEMDRNRGGITSDRVIGMLLQRPEPKREVELAKQLYDVLDDRRCTWTGRVIARRYDVDHVIPFSLWGNNHLWNLVPADAKVNNAKRDRLPSGELMQERKLRVIRCWQYLRDHASQRFDREAATLLGRPLSGPLAWEEDLFARLREAVEVTALQRGVERWAPPT